MYILRRNQYKTSVSLSMLIISIWIESMKEYKKGFLNPFCNLPGAPITFRSSVNVVGSKVYFGFHLLSCKGRSNSLFESATILFQVRNKVSLKP